MVCDILETMSEVDPSHSTFYSFELKPNKKVSPYSYFAFKHLRKSRAVLETYGVEIEYALRLRRLRRIVILIKLPDSSQSFLGV